MLLCFVGFIVCFYNFILIFVVHFILCLQHDVLMLMKHDVLVLMKHDVLVLMKCEDHQEDINFQQLHPLFILQHYLCNCGHLGLLPALL